MKSIITALIILSLGLVTGCTKTTMNSNPNYTYIYTDDDEYKSKRVDYLGYGLGGQGFGGYSMGGYGLTGYAGQIP